MIAITNFIFQAKKLKLITVWATTQEPTGQRDSLGKASLSLWNWRKRIEFIPLNWEFYLDDNK